MSDDTRMLDVRPYRLPAERQRQMREEATAHVQQALLLLSQLVVAEDSTFFDLERWKLRDAMLDVLKARDQLRRP
jgi:hypothetical protein